MRYIIELIEQEPIPAFTPQGMAPYHVKIYNREIDVFGEFGMTAPAALIQANNTEEECFRVASFLAHTILRLSDGPQISSLYTDAAYDLFRELSLHKPAPTLGQIRLKAFGEEGYRVINWPDQLYSLEFLHDVAEADLNKIALTQIAANNHSTDPLPRSKTPKI